MPEPKTYKIVIVNRRSTWPSRLLQWGFVWVVALGPISLGMWVGSSAMQWMGFVLSIVVLIALAAKAGEKITRTVRSFAEARRAIDELEDAEHHAGH